MDDTEYQPPLRALFRRIARLFGHEEAAEQKKDAPAAEQQWDGFRTSPLGKALRKRAMPDERLEVLQREWHRFRDGRSEYQQYIRECFERLDYRAPFEGMERKGQEKAAKGEARAIDSIALLVVSMGQHSWNEFAAAELVRPVSNLTLEDLRRDEELFVYFLDEHLDTFQRYAAQKQTALGSTARKINRAQALEEFAEKLENLLPKLPAGPTRDRTVRTLDAVQHSRVMALVYEEFGHKHSIHDPEIRRILKQQGWKVDEK